MTLVAGCLFVSTMLPIVTGPAGDPDQSALRENLELLRTQIELYRYEHDGHWPAEGTSDADAFTAALLEPRSLGEERTPYIVGLLPTNPVNGSRAVRVVDTPTLPPPDGSTGWLYSSTSGRIVPNVAASRRSLR